MDYFVSGDVLESPQGVNYYSEQLIRLGDQAIWYNPVQVPDDLYGLTREQLGIEPDAPVFALLQSTFKLHPEYDFWLAEIFKQVPGAYLLMVDGRQETWTEALKQRLRNSLEGCSVHILFSARLVSACVTLQCS